MGSFKVQKSKGAKQEARTAGVFLALIGVVVWLFALPIAGEVMVVLGLIFLLRLLRQVNRGKREGPVLAPARR